MKTLLLVILTLVGQMVYGVSYYTVQSGNFSSTTTWNLGIVPSLGGDTWSNGPGITLTYDVNNRATTGWGNCTNNGFLVMTNLPCYLLMNGNLSGGGTNLIGSATTPVSFTSSNTPMCYIQFTNSTAQLTMVGTNSMPMYGTPHLTNLNLSVAAVVGATSITVSNAPAWLSTNDVIWIAPTNTIQGQGGEYYMVGTVAGNVISFLNVAGTGNTNFYPGMSFSASIPSSGRPAGTVVAVLDCSVVVLEMTQRATSTITGIVTNTVTGIQAQNLGRGLAYNCSGWMVSYSTANNCLNGGFAYNYCSGWTVSYSTVNNCLNGGLACNYCSGWTVSYSTDNNCLSGGIAYNYCSGWTVSYSTANNCNYGGLAYNNCSGWTVSYSTANNCLNGGLVYYNCPGWTVSYSTANNCLNGGLAYYNCPGWTISYSTANNCLNGGITYYNCSGWTVSYSTNNNSSPLFLQSWSIIAQGSLSTNDTTINAANGGTSSPYALIQTDGRWVGINGSVTNNSGTYVHTCTSGNSNLPVALTLQFGVRPGAHRNISVSTQATNNVVYSAGIGGVGLCAPATFSIVNTGGGGGGWSNSIISISNTSTLPIIASIWVQSQGGVGSNGYSKVNIGQDMVVLNQ
jgi:hypothetical protein